MKSTPLAAVGLLCSLFLAGCGAIDFNAPHEADRVLEGTVTYASGDPLPEGSEVIVRVVDLSSDDARGEVLGEQLIKNPGTPPFPFRIEYRAENAVLMRRVNVEARISVGGKLRYASQSGHPITLGNYRDGHVVQVEFVGR